MKWIETWFLQDLHLSKPVYTDPTSIESDFSILVFEKGGTAYSLHNSAILTILTILTILYWYTTIFGKIFK